MLVLALIRLRQGSVVQSGWIAASAGALVFGSFIWAVTVGGDVIQERFQGIVDSGVMQTYQDNRGFMLDYTIQRDAVHLSVRRRSWAMGNDVDVFRRRAQLAVPGAVGGNSADGMDLRRRPADVGVLSAGAILVAMRHSYKLAVEPRRRVINDFATMVFMIQLLICRTVLHGPGVQHAAGHHVLACHRGAAGLRAHADVENEGPKEKKGGGGRWRWVPGLMLKQLAFRMAPRA